MQDYGHLRPAALSGITHKGHRLRQSPFLVEGSTSTSTLLRSCLCSVIVFSFGSALLGRCPLVRRSLVAGAVCFFVRVYHIGRADLCFAFA